MPFNQRSAFAKYVGPQKKPVIDSVLLRDLSDVSVLENQACAQKVALAAQIWDSCIHQTIQVGDLIMDAGNYAASETAKVLGCSKTVADTFAEIGMDLRLRLPAVNEAFHAGELDLARVRTIYRTTSSLSLGAAQRVEVEVLNAARRLSPGPLATEISDIIQRTTPDEVAELREDLKMLVGVRYRDKDLVSTLEADLEAADAASSWQAITEMAATLCRRDPRTRSQRLAAAYMALMHREDYVVCTCTVDEDNPCTANRELPDRRVPLTSITIDLATLAAMKDLPAYLAGHGLIDADYARELAANSDWQIVITEARNVADELNITLDDYADETAPHAAARTEDETLEPTEAVASAATEIKSATAGRGNSGNHLTFHPLGRGRRRRGLGVPTPQAGVKLEKSTPARSGTYQGSYTLIAALENAIAANPDVAQALYPDGHGGFVEPPAGALEYTPRKALAELVRHRDRTCRFPGCDVAAARCELDHVIPYFHHDPARGGWTVLTNLHCLCRYHHSLKTMGAWNTTMLAGAVEFWESNSGSTAVTLPGSVVGTTDLTGETLIPHIPRKRKPQGGVVPAETVTPETTTDDTASSALVAAEAATPQFDPWTAGGSGEGRVDAEDPAPY